MSKITLIKYFYQAYMHAQLGRTTVLCYGSLLTVTCLISVIGIGDCHTVAVYKYIYIAT